MRSEEREKYHEYARRITHAVDDFQIHAHWREKRIAKSIKAGKVPCRPEEVRHL